MHLLVLTTRPPYPPDSGGKVVIYDRLRELHRRGHRLSLVSLREE